MRYELSEYMKVCSIFFSFYMFDRRNSFRPNDELGRDIGEFGWVISYRAYHLDVSVLFDFMGFFPIFLDFFFRFIRR